MKFKPENEKSKLLYIGGQWQESKSQDFIKVDNPATEEILGEIVDATAEEVNQAVAAAREGLKTWRKTTIKERKEVLLRVLAGIEKHEEELAQIISAELGAPITFSLNVQVRMALREMKATLEEVENFEFEKELFGSKIIREPFGVIACITPWNYPLNQIQRKMTPALLAGNTIVVKPASSTPYTAIKLAKIMEEAQVPAGVFNLVLGSGSKAGKVLAEHKDVRVISFTGSTEVGEGLFSAAAQGIKKLVLELGGKSPCIHLKGGDYKISMARSMGDITSNTGQSCSALTRLFVPKDELETVKEEIKEYLKGVKVGDPSDPEVTMGSLSSKDQMEKVLKFIEEGKEEGAELFVGGNRIGEKGYFVEPTVFIHVKNDMKIAKEEIFGPVLSVISYDTVEEAIEMANDTTYGLAGAVVGPAEEALSVARQIEAGNVYINRASKSPKVPFGGYKASGLGREVGLYGMEDYLEIKAIIEGK